MLYNSLSSAGLRRYIKEYEVPERLNRYGRDETEIIFRKGGFVGSLIEHHKSMERTMNHARAHIDNLEKGGKSVSSGTIFIADRLTCSKGRFVRAWHAPVGGLWGSMIYVSTLLPQTRLLLPLAIGVSCCETFHQFGVKGAEIRWINDILIEGRKAAGILLEGFYGPFSQEEYNLVGFGINVNNEVFPVELQNCAASVSEFLGAKVDLPAFTYCFLAKVSWNMGLLCHGDDNYLREGAWGEQKVRHPLIDRWCELSNTLSRKVVYGFDVENEPQYEAYVTGISDSGGLMLKLDDGSETIEHSGEIRYI